MSNYAVDRDRWAQLGICEQMGNIGAEVGRAIHATRKGREKRAQGAIERALDLFDATAQAWATRDPARTKEVLRARNEFLRLFFGGTFDSDAESLERYFTHFAVAAHNSTLRT